MTTELPEKPLSRKESYLAKIAGEAVEIPEKPESRTEQYLAYIAENGGGGGGGGGSYTAGYGIDITNREISVDTSVIHSVEYVDLTITNLTASEITVTPSKTVAQVKALTDAGAEVVYRLTIAQSTGDFIAGKYMLQTVLSSSTVVFASSLTSTTNGADVQSYVFVQEANSASGSIFVKHLGTLATWYGTKNQYDTIVTKDNNTLYYITEGA